MEFIIALYDLYCRIPVASAGIDGLETAIESGVAIGPGFPVGSPAGHRRTRSAENTVETSRAGRIG